MPLSWGMPTIWTIGHSNRPAAQLIEFLTAQAVALVADVRRFPGRGALESSLREAGIGYRHFPELGGRRGGRLPDSPNTAWRVEAFNAYADHMQSDEFRAALDALTAEAERRPTAIMCAEALPWQCHRRLIADALIARGWTVLDIMGTGPPRSHAFTEFGKVREGTVIDPGLLEG